MNIERLHQILNGTTIQMRKGGVVEESISGYVAVIQVQGMPHEREHNELEKVDCHFVTIGVDKEKAQPFRDELISILKEYPGGEQTLKKGPSYMHVGGVIGNQGAAFKLFGLGEVLGFWKVCTPKSLGMEGAIADQMAGVGMVNISGFNNSQNS